MWKRFVKFSKISNKIMKGKRKITRGQRYHANMLTERVISTEEELSDYYETIRLLSSMNERLRRGYPTIDMIIKKLDEIEKFQEGQIRTTDKYGRHGHTEKEIADDIAYHDAERRVAIDLRYFIARIR